MLLLLLLYAALAAVYAVPHERQIAQGAIYTVQVRTGDFPDGGTRALVTITITGDQGHTDVIKLTDKDGGGAPFMHSSTDTFHFFATYVGRVKSITLSHDNTHDSPGWFVDWVKVTVSEEPPVTYVFLLNRWLATSKDDHQTHGTFTPV